MALPETLTSTPLAEQLADEDRQHDGWGGASWHIVQAYLEAPDTPPEMLEVVKRIQDTFVPQRADFVVAYASEAANAQARLEELEAISANMESIPLGRSDSEGLDLELSEFRYQDR